MVGGVLVPFLVAVVDFIKNSCFSEEFKKLVIVFFSLVGMATNLAATLIYGKPFAPFLISGLG